jgi:hypothetical protein
MSDLDRQETGIDADEPVYHFCKKCGNEMQWADCWMIDCEDGWYDMSEQDCINYEPGTYAKCETCEGHGGWCYCPQCDKP